MPKLRLKTPPKLRQTSDTLVRKLKKNMLVEAERSTDDRLGGLTNVSGGLPATLITLTGDVNGKANENVVGAIQGIEVDTTDPLTGQTLVFDGTKYVPTTPSAPDSAGHVIEDEGTTLTAEPIINFVGLGVTATVSGGKIVVTIPGTDVYATDVELAAAVAAAVALLIPKSLVDAKGDLLVGTADNTLTRLPVGTTGQVPYADPTATTGIRWGDSTAVGRYRGMVWTPDGAGGFDFVVNSDGEPVYALADLE
jgi:hypothetical protein